MVKLGAFFLNALFSFFVLSRLTAGQDCTNKLPDPNGLRCTDISNFTSSCGRFYPTSVFPNNISTNLEESLNEIGILMPFYAEDTQVFDCTVGIKEKIHFFFCSAIMPHAECEVEEAGSIVRRVTTTLLPCRSLCEEIYLQCREELETSQILRTFDRFCLLSDCSRYPVSDCVSRYDSPTTTVANTNVATEANTNGNETTSESDRPTSACPALNASYFSREARGFAEGWVASWATLCFISTSITILSFLIHTSRFKYPWRPIVYLAVAFNLHSLGYFFSLALGREQVTCPGEEFVELDTSWGWRHTPCILVFILLYYSMMAAFLWWLVLTLCWFLASSLKWSEEAISRLFPLYHLLAWLLPLLMTIILIAAHAIAADELTGTCFVLVSAGRRLSFYSLLLGVVVPLCVFLLVGAVFLIMGFISLIRVYSFMSAGGKKTEKLIIEKLVVRIGVFVSVYTIPAVVVIGCFGYELNSRPKWSTLETREEDSCTECRAPNSAVFMVRILMLLLIGALTGIWIWTKKTVESWRTLPARLRTWIEGKALPTENVDYNMDAQQYSQPNNYRVSTGVPNSVSGSQYGDSHEDL